MINPNDPGSTRRRTTCRGAPLVRPLCMLHPIPHPQRVRGANDVRAPLVGDVIADKKQFSTIPDSFLPKPNYSSILFSNSLRANNSSLDMVTPLPIFPPSADQSRISYFASLSFQLIRLSSLAQPSRQGNSISRATGNRALIFSFAVSKCVPFK